MRLKTLCAPAARSLSSSTPPELNNRDTQLIEHLGEDAGRDRFAVDDDAIAIKYQQFEWGWPAGHLFDA